MSDWYADLVTRQMTATEFKAHVLALLDEVAAGDEVEITKHGKTVARLVGARGGPVLQGRLSGVARTVEDDDDLLSTGLGWNLP